MDRRLICVAVVLAIATSFQGRAQTIDGERSRGLRGRISVGLDWKAAKGLHFTLDEELRSSSESVKYLTRGAVSWKARPWLRLGSGYDFIYEPGDIRHRLSIFSTGILKYGDWTFSLREKAQVTHLTKNFNEYQRPRNALTLKSRLKASFRMRSPHLAPYSFVEFRNLLNGAKYSSARAEDMHYCDIYLNRIRVGLGTEWKLNPHNSLDAFVWYDYTQDKDVDAKKNGMLSLVTVERADLLVLGLSWSFAIK